MGERERLGGRDATERVRESEMKTGRHESWRPSGGPEEWEAETRPSLTDTLSDKRAGLKPVIYFFFSLFWAEFVLCVTIVAVTRSEKDRLFPPVEERMRPMATGERRTARCPC